MTLGQRNLPGDWSPTAQVQNVIDIHDAAGATQFLTRQAGRSWAACVLGEASGVRADIQRASPWAGLTVLRHSSGRCPWLAFGPLMIILTRRSFAESRPRSQSRSAGAPASAGPW